MAVITDPIKRYAAKATAVTGTKVRPSKEVEHLIEVRNDLFGVEARARQEVENKITVATTDFVHRIIGAKSKLELPYKKLSLEPLKWMRNNRPVFAMFSLDNPIMRIRREWSGATRVTAPFLPDPIHDIYRHAMDAEIFRVTNSWQSAKTLTAEFKGMIPAPVREEIRKATPMFGPGALYLIAEADWKVRSVSVDPLVVGWDGKHLRLISQFDLTNLERYMKEEFPA